MIVTGALGGGQPSGWYDIFTSLDWVLEAVGNAIEFTAEEQCSQICGSFECLKNI